MFPRRAQARFLPVNDHEAEWKVAAEYGSPDEAYVLVVDGGGVVRFRMRGSESEAGYAQVKKMVETMR